MILDPLHVIMYPLPPTFALELPLPLRPYRRGGGGAVYSLVVIWTSVGSHPHETSIYGNTRCRLPLPSVNPTALKPPRRAGGFLQLSDLPLQARPPLLTHTYEYSPVLDGQLLFYLKLFPPLPFQLKESHPYQLDALFTTHPYSFQTCQRFDTYPQIPVFLRSIFRFVSEYAIIVVTAKSPASCPNLIQHV